jgi:malate synthase
MEDTATAEISRAQVWSWLRAGRFSREQVEAELAAVDAAEDAKELFAEVALAEEFVEFLTLPGYVRIP